PDGTKIPVSSYTPRALGRAVYNQRVFATLRDTKTNTSIQLEFHLDPIIRQTVDDFVKTSAAVAATNSNYAPRYPGKEAVTLLDAYLGRGQSRSRSRAKKLGKPIASGYLNPNMSSSPRGTKPNSSPLTQKGLDF